MKFYTVSQYRLYPGSHCSSEVVLHGEFGSTLGGEDSPDGFLPGLQSFLQLGLPCWLPSMSGRHSVPLKSPDVALPGRSHSSSYNVLDMYTLLWG